MVISYHGFPGFFQQCDPFPVCGRLAPGSTSMGGGVGSSATLGSSVCYTQQDHWGGCALSAPGHSPVCPMLSPVAATALLLAQGRSALTSAQVETEDLHEEMRLLN